MALRCLTFELSGRQRQDARPGQAKMYTVPPARAWWPAVGAPRERGGRQRCARGVAVVGLPMPCWPAVDPSRSALTTVVGHVFKPPQQMTKSGATSAHCGGPTNWLNSGASYAVRWLEVVLRPRAIHVADQGAVLARQ